MKDIKSYIIGFLMATCMFLFIGATTSNSGQGKFQALIESNTKYLVDTHTGELWTYDATFGGAWRNLIKPDTFKRY